MKILASNLRVFIILCFIGGLRWSHAQSVPPVPTLPPGEMLDVWEFSSSNYLSLRGDAPSSLTNVSLVPTWAGTGLQVDSTNAAWIIYPVVETNGQTNLSLTQGTISCWFSANFDSGDDLGSWGTFLEIGTWNTNLSEATGAFGLYISEDSSTLACSAQTNGVATNYLNAPISWNAGEWHQITLTYSATNTALYLEGQFVTNGPGITIIPDASVISNGFAIGSDAFGTALKQSHGVYNDLISYNYQLDAATISNYYADESQNVSPLPLSGGGGFHGDDDPPPSPGGGGGTNSGGGSPSYSSPDYGSNFFLQVLPHGTNQYNSDADSLTIFLTNTIPYNTYEVWSTTNLQGTNTIWILEQTLISSAMTNFTVTTISMTGRPQLFLKGLAYSLDTDNVGIPDWWQLKYFGYIGIDPNGDPAGDGWSNLQKYQLGMNPNTFYPPPAPTGLTATVNSNGLLTVSWNPASNLPSSGAGAVTGYTLDGTTLSASQTNYTMDVSIQDFYGNPPFEQSSQTLQVNYANGTSATANLGLVIPGQKNVPTTFVRGSNDALTLVALSIPQGIQALRVYWATDIFATPSTFDVPVTMFTNNVYVIPYSQIPIGLVLVGTRTIDASGNLYEPTGFWWQEINNIPFYDGSVQTEQNVSFMLQAASSTTSYSYGITFPGVGGDFYYPFGIATNYVSDGFYDITDGGGTDWGRDYPFTYPDEAKPFYDNYYLRNFMATTGDINSDGSFKSDILSDPEAWDPPFTNSVFANGYDLRFLLGNFETNTTAPSAILPTDQYFFYGDDWSNVGITDNPSTGQFTLQANTFNYFGLSIESALAAYSTNGVLTLQTLDVNNPVPDNAVAMYPHAAPPSFQTVDYYFGRPGIDPLPGNAAFNTSFTTPLMVVGFGQSMNITAWAKQHVLGGYETVYAYPQQYFDNAYAADTNGNITTNSAGILSEYGDFFPIQAGTVYLTTKPDAATGTVGTNEMQVMKLIVDVNHDGTIDPSFTGPDNTWPDHPYVMWANNDYDRNLYDGADKTNYEDSVTTNQGNNIPDCNYHDHTGARVIPTKRDLQYFARLWVYGIDSNLVAGLPIDATVTLSWGDVGSPNYSNPTIDLFTAADSDGGIGYLTNETTAIQQTNISLSPYIGRLGPGQSIPLNASTFSGWAGNHFIWCGVSNGTGSLTLTIADANSNVVAQTSAYIQIMDIKDMYERWTVGDDPNIAPTNQAYLADNDMPQGETQRFQYPASAGTNTPYILYVHGWNMSPYEKARFAETAFKRLYWQGYQGRFGVFQWPTGYGFTGIGAAFTNFYNYDTSEFYAWQSAEGLLNKLNDLNAKYPGQVYMVAHSMGNVVAGEALRLSSSQVVNTYVASQGAISAHTYDTNITNYSFTVTVRGSSINFGPKTPNIYGDWFASNSVAAGKRVNFYNINDYALAQTHWQLNQLKKPDLNVSEAGGTNWTYGYTGTTNDPPPWTFWKQSGSTFGSPVVVFLNTDIFHLNQRYEVMAYAAQSWTTALGTTPVNTLAGSINLTNVWLGDPTGNPYTEHFWHSAEFRGDNALQGSYWGTLLESSVFNLK